MAKVKRIFAQEILNSQGNPTIETTVELSDGAMVRSSVPSGVLRSTYEASELRDNDPRRYNGMGVLTAVDNVNNLIAPRLLGMEVSEQPKIDRFMIEMDGTQNKSRLGVNAILSVSQSIAKAGAMSSLLPLSLYLRQFTSGSVKPVSAQLGKKIPIPIFSLLEGGSTLSNTLDFREYLVIPASSKEYYDSLEMGVLMYHSLGNVLREKGLSVLVADRGGYSPNILTNKDALSILKESVEVSGYQFSLDVFLGIHAGANTFKRDNGYVLSDHGGQLNSTELINFYQDLASDFSLIYIEDPFSEDDWKGWKEIYSELSGRLVLVGDDLVTTNPYRLQTALDNNVISGINIKPDQIGTITEALAVCEMARFKNLKIIISDRVSETMDDFIADFAVAVRADYVKFGAPARERVAKYNRLLEIVKKNQSP